jgi:archaetidylinositol phosphate synthase
MLEKYFKKSSEVFAKPFIKILKLLNLKPNTVSLLGLFVIITGSYFFYVENKNLGIVLIFLGSAIDGLDGPYAREMDLVSERGGVLDSLIDRIGELIIWSVVGISFTDSDLELFTIFSILVSSNLTPYMRAKSEYFGLQNTKGLAARPERVIFAVLFMFFDFNFLYVYIFAIISWITVIQRFTYLYKHLSK